MPAFIDALPVVGGVVGPTGLIWAVIRYIVKQAIAGRDAAEARANAADKRADEAEASEALQRTRANEADIRATKFEAKAAGLAQTVTDLTDQIRRLLNRPEA